jgi:hypothetical protein
MTLCQNAGRNLVGSMIGYKTGYFKIYLKFGSDFVESKLENAFLKVII